MQEQRTNYYDFINTCYECERCGKKKYVELEKTDVGSKVTRYGTDDSRKSGKTEINDYDVLISADGYHHRKFKTKHGWCEECERKHTRRIFGIMAILIGAVAVLLVGALVLNLLSDKLTGSRDIALKSMSSAVEKYEADSDHMLADVKTKDAVGVYTAQSLSERLEKSDYLFSILRDKESSVQKFSIGDEVRYAFSLKGESWGELRDKTYIICTVDGEKLIIDAGEKIAYYPSCAEYQPLLDSLESCLPTALCCKGKYDSQGWYNNYDDIDHMESAQILYSGSEAVALLYISADGDGYYEDAGDDFYRIVIEERSPIANTPRIDDCEERK